jgi:hypothetical protein
MEILDAVKIVRAAQARDAELTRVVAAICSRAECIDLGALARAHPQVVIELAENVVDMASLEADPITFTVPDDEGFTLP